MHLPFPLILLLCFMLASFLTNYIFLSYLQTAGNRDLQNNTISDGQVRWGSRRKPSAGGFSFFIVFLIAFGVSVVYSGTTQNNSSVGLLVACVIGFLVGFADDAFNTIPMLKFTGQVACATVLIATGNVIEISELPILNAFVTGLWVIGMMNSVNMLDNMDGIVTCTSIVTLATVACVLYLFHPNDTFGMVLTIGEIGALLGFLYFNWYPSKMYMGDTGSQFLGVFLAWISIKYLWNIPLPSGSFLRGFNQFLIPALAFTVPLMDTVTVTFRRIMRGQSPFMGGRDHITHKLAIWGLSDRRVVGVLTLLSVVSLLSNLYLFNHLSTWEGWQTTLFVAYYLGTFITLQVIYATATKQEEARKVEHPAYAASDV